MYLRNLSLLHFKNIAEASIELSPHLNCFVGDNGTGKTNLLDAVHYLSVGKSVFNLSDNQCTLHEKEGFVIDGTYVTPEQRTERIVCSYKRGASKKLMRGGKEYEKLSDHIGLIPLVMITPADTALINEAGEERRKYLNSFISQLDKPYLTALVRYNQVLAERNKLLKNQYTVGFSDIIEVFNQQLSTHGATIYQVRCRLVESLTPLVSRYYALLSEDREQVELTYKSELHDTPLETLLRESLQRDRVNLFTTCGIHRDDLKMTLGGYPLRKYGSQGQQKSFLTALKLAQYDLIAGQNPHQPLLLLDDIFDKLDTRRVEQLLAIITSDRFGQIFITDCNKVRLEHLLHACHTDYALFKMDAGSLQPLTPTP